MNPSQITKESDPLQQVTLDEHDSTEEIKIQQADNGNNTVYMLQCPFPNCAKEFKEKNNIKVHMRAHLGIKLFACRHCDKRFNSSSNQREHERRHTKTR